MNKLQSIDRAQRLYTFQCGAGFSCCGFDYLDKKARAVAAWAKVIPPLAELGTPEHYAECMQIIDYGAKYNLKTGGRCNAELVPELIGLEGKRVEVLDCCGERRRFWVGKSTGWLPCHIERYNTRSHGGPAAMGTPYQSIRVVRP